MSKDYTNRHDRDELDIEGLIRSLRQESVTPPPQIQPEEEVLPEPEQASDWPEWEAPHSDAEEEPVWEQPEQSADEAGWEGLYEQSDEDLQPVQELPVYAPVSPEGEVPDAEGAFRMAEWEEAPEPLPEKPRRSFGETILSFFRRKKREPEPEESSGEEPVQEETPDVEPEQYEQEAYEPLEEQEQYPEEETDPAGVYEPEPELEFTPEDFAPLPEEAPDIVLQQMQEEERKADLIRDLKSGQVVMLNLHRREKQKAQEETIEENAQLPRQTEEERVRLDPRAVMDQTRVMPPDPILPEEAEKPDVPEVPAEPGPRIFTLNLRNRALENSQTRAEVFDQANEEDDDQLETLERMLAKHAEESRRRREAEAERRRQAEEEARLAREEAQQEAARLAAEAEAAKETQTQDAEEGLEQTKPIDAQQLRQLAEEKLAEKTAAADIQQEAEPSESEEAEEARPGLLERMLGGQKKGAREAVEPEETEEEEDDEPLTSAYDEQGELIDESLLEGEQKGSGLLRKMTTGLLGLGRKQRGSDLASDAEFEEVERKGLLGRGGKEKQSGGASDDNVIRMPVDKPNALQKKLEEMNERADEFAQSMFQSDTDEAKAAERAHRLAEQYIPATDYEEHPVKEKKKTKAEKAPERRAPDTSPKELNRIYHSSWKSSLARLPLQFIMAVLLLIFTAVAGGEIPFVTVEALAGNEQLSGLILTIGLCIAAAVGLDTLLEGIIQLFRKRPGLNTMASFGVVFTLIDSLWFVLVGRDGPLPFCGFAALSLWAVAWGNCSKKDGLQRATGAIAGRSEFERLTMDQGKLDNWGTFTKESGSTKGFGSQMQEEDGAQRVYRYAAPVMLVACLLFGILSVVGQKDPAMLIWSWSVIFVLATPLSATLAYGMPYLVNTRRLLRNGAVLAGWEGAESMKGEAGIILKDRDLFPEGSVQFNGIRNFGQVSLEKLTGCTASMIREADVGLAKIFDDQIRIQGGFYRRVDELKYSDAGGFTGLIRGDKVLVGTAGFMKMQGIELEQGQHVKNAVFCVINGQLQGIFALNYNLPRNVEPNLEALIHGHVYPVLALRDFNITPAMLQQRFRLPVDRMQYPPVDKRHQLSARNQPHNQVLGALVFREGIVPYTDAVLGGRRLCHVVRLNTVLSILASVVGALLGFYLTLASAYASLSPMNILFFLLMWLIPTVLISHAADKF